MRALVLKNHYESTASLAYLVRKEVPGIEIYGGIALNRTVGGVNPAAVERYLKAKSRKRSIKNDERSLKLFTEYFGAETPLTQITAARISAWKAERLAATADADA